MFNKLLLAGRVDLAIPIIEKYIDDPLAQVTRFMFAALTAKSVEDLPEGNFNKLSVVKVTPKFGNISALHLAALNPNLEILKKLLNMVTANANSKH